MSEMHIIKLPQKALLGYFNSHGMSLSINGSPFRLDANLSANLRRPSGKWTWELLFANRNGVYDIRFIAKDQIESN